MWSDNETDIDLLQFKYLGASITRIIRTEQLLPTTIGVFGDWGSGKSSLLKMVENDISGEDGILTINFNGWLFEGFEDAKTALMGTILEQIQERIKNDQNLLQKAGGLLSKLIKRVRWFQLVSFTGRYAVPALMGMPDLAAANLGMDTVTTVVEQAKEIKVDEAKKILKEAPGGAENIRRNIREFRTDFAKLLEQSEIKTLVVFVDDLDRCNTDTIIETLEAIKLFLFVPRTVFILGADERLIEYAVRRRFPELPGTDAEVGRDYLEKLIQIPIRIPPLSGAENHSYINLLFAQNKLEAKDFETVCQSVAKFKPSNVSDLSFDMEICRDVVKTDGAIPIELEYDLDLASQIVPILVPGLGGNPRRTKRFLNTLLLRMQMAADRGLELKRQVLAKLMVLEYLKSVFFKQLAGLQANQEGAPEELSLLEAVLQAEEQQKEQLTEPEGLESEAEPEEPLKSKGTKPAKAGKKQNNKAAASEGIIEKDVPPELQPWLADPWMKRWLMSEPGLSNIDLRPYFYIAHDTIGALGATQMRLSPIAKRILDRLLSSGAATRKIGLTMARDMLPPDAASIFEDLAQRVRQAESLDKSPQKILFELMAERPDLIPQLVSLYGSLPETKITMGTLPMLYQVVKDSPSEAATKSLVERWSNSANKNLAIAAKQLLKRFN
jgi:hypothetical protein